MFEELLEITRRFEEIEARLAAPDVLVDAALYRTLLKDHHRLLPLYRDGSYGS